MKKVLTGVVSGILCLSLAVPAWAATLDQDSDPMEANTTVTTSEEATFEVVIPEKAEIAFDVEHNPIGAIAYKEGNLEPDTYVTVSLSRQTALENEADSCYTIPYQVQDADGAFESVVYPEDTKPGTQTPLSVYISQEAWEEAKSGDYSATLTFTITYTNPHDGEGKPGEQPEARR